MGGFVPLILSLLGAVPLVTELQPVPQPMLQGEAITWKFEEGVGPWVPERNCRLRAENGVLHVETTGEDPYFHRPVDLPGGHYRLEIRARNDNGAGGAVYWTTETSPHRGEDKSAHFALQPDSQWHEYQTHFHAEGRLRDLRIDPGGDAGFMEIAWIRLNRMQPHPLAMETLAGDGETVTLTVRNQTDQPIAFRDGGRDYEVKRDATVAVERKLEARQAVEVVKFSLQADDLTPVERVLSVYHDDAPVQWETLGELSRDGERLGTLEICADGAAVRFRREGETLAALAPLVWDWHSGALLEADVERYDDGARIRGRVGESPVTILLEPHGDALRVALDGPDELEGPVVRVFGTIEQGLFSGLEHLGKGEHSSSKLDIETDEHMRFAPDRLHVTMPLMHISTAEGSVAVRWHDMSLQPTFATPNFYDAARESRMSLRGNHVEADIRFGRNTLEEDVVWFVQRHGLPRLPQPPRSRREQIELCVWSLTEGPIRSENGWGHCVEERWARRFFTDIGSTLWRLEGTTPEMPELVPGGSHIPNEAIYFVAGQAESWLQYQRSRARSLINQQQPDGSYRYQGEYARGHFEDTASGVCARPAAALLEFAYKTGDEEALQAGLKTLDYMQRFRTPRGAQVWEIPLHTPDILASGYLVWAYVRGYQLTGNEQYLECARRWAISGVPFVYLWGEYPVMEYATIPVLGATNWRAPNWIGLPVQWCGLVYAYGLTMLAPYDDTLDWHQLAEGILIAGEQMQVPRSEGDYAGLLPDSFVLRSQTRRGPMINPAGLVSLRLAVEGRVDSLAVAEAGGHRVVGPFPLEVVDGKVISHGREGQDYQVVIDGQQVVDIQSSGRDVIPLQ